MSRRDGDTGCRTVVCEVATEVAQVEAQTVGAHNKELRRRRRAWARGGVWGGARDLRLVARHEAH
eukprot:2569643-Prymnesium_polylepis.1